ncbi:MAG: hypothetical protein IJX67_02075 [Oscillospiraceae bacterium]|nr:hypothetical protein [Oscillospiraceae bacterium]
MKEKFLSIPLPLQKQILLRLGGSGIGLATLLLVLSHRSDWRLMLPCIALIVLCVGSTLSLYDRCVQSKYVAVTGDCVEIEKSAWRRRTKAIYLRNDQYSIKLAGVRKIKNLIVGDQLTVYIADNTAVYEVDGYHVICNYLAIEKAFPLGKD